MSQPRQRLNWRQAYAAAILAALCAAAAADVDEPIALAPVDERLLPPAVSRAVDYERDIRPILEASCLRCHGAERPKSGLRLTDRVSALKGGSYGAVIKVGNSAESPLIHYVSRVVEDLEMPPEGQGEPLTDDEVGRLRAWIDQGFAWGAAEGGVETQSTVEMTPVMSWTWVDGDRGKFRELEWQEDGWNGGLERFELSERYSDGRSVTVEGRVLRHDYRVSVELRRPDLGFARVGYEQFRKWFDDSGGHHEQFQPPTLDLSDDLHLDIGRVWANLGLTLPDWPRVVLGYEYQFKEGDRSMLTWGRVNPAGGGPFDARHIYPSAKAVDEHAHVLTLEVQHEIGGFAFEDNARAEFYSLETRRADALLVPPGATRPALVSEFEERRDDVLVANVVQLTKELSDWWFLSAGYRYAWLDGDAGVELETKDGAGQPAAGSAWQSDEILLQQSSHIANLNSQFRPLPPLTATLGAQAEWLHQDTFGDLNLDELTDPNDPTAGLLLFPATARSDLDKVGVEEAIQARFTGVPHTVLFGEARLKQEELSQFKEQVGGPRAFLLETDATAKSEEFRGGFTVSPWRPFSFTAQYRHRDRKRDYDYPRDELPPVNTVGPGYSGFIRDRDLSVEEFEARLAIRPAQWLKTTLGYQWTSSDYRTTTDAASEADVGPNATPGGQILAGDYEAHVFSANVSASPIARLYLTASLSYQDAVLTTADHGNLSVAPYDGDIFSTWLDLRYALDNRTDLFGRYVLSESDFGQHNAADGLPLGLEHSRQMIQAGIVRRIGELASTRLQYGYYRYREPSSGHLNDYTAHQVLLAFTFRWL